MLHALRINLQRALTAKQRTGTFQFALLRPSGNDTGLVTGIVRNAKQRKQIADTFQAMYPSIEQVGFINPDSRHAELLMAGGEFCGNATRSAAYQILGGQVGKIAIKVSGVKKQLIAGVTEKGEAFSQMPVYTDPSHIEPDAARPGNALVHLEGITHYIDFNMQQIRGLTVDEIKVKARAEMAQRGIDKGAACGIIYVDQHKDWYAIHPIVYVRDADTLYYETACGSGTTALGLLLAQRAGKSIREVPILQPSGLFINISVAFDGKKFGYTQIQSKMQKLEQGEFEVSFEQTHYHFTSSRSILRSLIRN